MLLPGNPQAEYLDKRAIHKMKTLTQGVKLDPSRFPVTLDDLRT
jgi:hypothetical protein